MEVNQTMVRGLILFGLGAAGAIYFFDPDKGPKRRKQLKKQWNDTVKLTSKWWDEHGEQIGLKAREISQSLGSQAVYYGNNAKTAAVKLAQNGNHRWSPSARTIGALGSALAFYSAGRRGTTGALLRTLSLGMFTRALMASR